MNTPRTLTLTIDIAAKCAECGKGGATPSGVCLACANKAIAGKAMTSPQGRAISVRYKKLFAAARRQIKKATS